MLAYALLTVAIAILLLAVQDVWDSWTLRELPAWPPQMAVFSPWADVSRPTIGNAPAIFLANSPLSKRMGDCIVLAVSLVRCDRHS